MEPTLSIKDLEVTISYDSNEDRVTFSSSRELINADIVLLLCNLYGLIDVKDRELATTIALQTVVNREKQVASEETASGSTEQ